MEGRRLDFDYKKKRQGKVTDDEIKQALEKFDDSKEIAEQSMFNLLECDVSAILLFFIYLNSPPTQPNVNVIQLYSLPSVRKSYDCFTSNKAKCNRAHQMERSRRLLDLSHVSIKSP